MRLEGNKEIKKLRKQLRKKKYTTTQWNELTEN